MKSKDICNDKATCTGCEACANVCPKDAIKMKSDWRGFLYPDVDQSRCVDCGLCRKRCPANQPPLEPFAFGMARAFVDGDRDRLRVASSGGAFGVVARHVLAEGGVVYGCTMDEDYDVTFIAVDRAADLPKLHGSKYVQSAVGMIYRAVKATLDEGRKAFFCGCPCQVAALRQYLNKDCDELLTMDLICHGVPSQPFFHDYVRDLRKQGVRAFRFRYKPELCGETKESSTVRVGYSSRDYYMTHFLWGKGCRACCYRCRYAGGARPGDFTAGDFRNNAVARLPIDDSHGASLVLFNTPKAQKLEDVFREAGTCLPLTTMHDAIGGDGGQLAHPSKNDARTDLMYMAWRLFGVRGPKALFKLERMLFHI